MIQQDKRLAAECGVKWARNVSYELNVQFNTIVQLYEKQVFHIDNVNKYLQTKDLSLSLCRLALDTRIKRVSKKKQVQASSFFWCRLGNKCIAPSSNIGWSNLFQQGAFKIQWWPTGNKRHSRNYYWIPSTFLVQTWFNLVNQNLKELLKTISLKNIESYPNNLWSTCVLTMQLVLWRKLSAYGQLHDVHCPITVSTALRYSLRRCCSFESTATIDI